MAGPKIKNIVILILLVTNLCLLLFNVGREARDRQLLGEARVDAITFLREQGIQVDEEQIPKTMTLEPMYVSRDVEKECVLATALLEGEVSVTARGAGVYRYSNKNGAIQFHSNGEFSAQFTEGVFRPEDSTLEDYGAGILERLDIAGEPIRRVTDGQTQGIVFQEYWQDVPLLNCQVTLNYQNGSLVSITGGRRLVGEPAENSSAEPITVATALMRFYTGMSAPGDVYTQISDITQGYVLTSTISDPMPLVPVWYITTDVGVFQMDILTGVPSRTA